LFEGGARRKKRKVVGSGLQARGKSDFEHSALFEGGARHKKSKVAGSGLQARGNSSFEHSALFEGGAVPYDRNNLYGGNILNDPKRVAEILSNLLKKLMAPKPQHDWQKGGGYSVGMGFSSASGLHKRKRGGASKQGSMHESRAASGWIEHVKAYQRKHPGMSYREALSEAGASY